MCILHQIMRRTEGKYLGSTRQDAAHKLLIFLSWMTDLFEDTHHGMLYTENYCNLETF